MCAASARHVAIVTPWYPTRDLPFRGAFVRAMVAATAPGCDRVTVYHGDAWVAAMSNHTERIVGRAHRALLSRALEPTPTVGGASLAHLPVPIPRGRGHVEIARRFSATLRAALGGRGIDAPVVHAHVGLPGGWGALRNARPDARIFVTEHASFLDKVLAEPEAVAMYDELLRRCTGFFAVGEAVRRPLTETFPHHASKIRIMPNPVSFDRLRSDPVTELRRWLFVGALTQLKGVDLLLEAFAKCRAEEPGLTLTLVGEGGLRRPLAERAAALGVSDAVAFTGPLPPGEALALMYEHDLLVHPSRSETFGMTTIEAVAAGLPVLVTRCGGPEETLAPVAEQAGEFIDVTDDPETIVAGYRRLCSRFPEDLDPGSARRDMAGRYGFQAVARAHLREWFPTDQN